MDTRAEESYAASRTTEGTSGETTVTEWLAYESFEDILTFFPANTSARRLRLFAVACCRRLPGLTECRLQVLDVAERHAEGLVDRDALRQAYRKAFGLAEERENNAEDQYVYHAAQAVAWALVPEGVGPRESTAYAAYHAGRAVPGLAERRIQALLLADIMLAPPSATVSPAWLTWHDGLLVAMAQKMYDGRDFSDMPVLADALQEGGCYNADILTHCRHPTEHVRGCWVVDLILEKA